MINPRTEILDEANDLVNGERNASYGPPNQDFARTAQMWNAYLEGVLERQKGECFNVTNVSLDTWDVAWMMTLLKASRATTSPEKRDHYADAAGYVACGWDCASEETS